MAQEQIIKAMASKLHAIDPHARAFLFGSRARGTARKDSDWDLLILIDKPNLFLTMISIPILFGN